MSWYWGLVIQGKFHLSTGETLCNNYPYTTSKGEGGKYTKQVSKGDLPIEVWTALL
jgi:hypothetical protein